MLAEKDRAFQPHVINLETLVPPDNFYRQLEAKLDLSFVRDLVRHLYKPFGRPSVDPVVFFKLQLIMFFEGIRSERQLMAQVQLNLAFRWYIGYDLHETIPHHSSLTKIRDRFGLEVFRRFFDQIVQLCVDAGLVWGQEVHFDGTPIQANAAYDQQIPRFYHQAQQQLHYLFPSAEPRNRGDLVTKYDGTHPVVKPNRYRKLGTYWVSPVDEAASPLGDGLLGYHLQYGVDGGKARIILNCLVTPASIQDNTPFLDVLWQTRFRWHLPINRAVADTKFGTTDNVVQVETNGIRAFMPLHADAKRTTNKGNTFGSQHFHFDAERNVYICPQGELLRFWTRDRYTQRLVYKACDTVCQACLVKAQCKTGKSGRRVGHSMFKALLDRVRAYHATPAYKKAMRKRQVWIEPRFAELKLWHQGRKFRLRGIRKVNIEALIKATGQNIKQLLKAKSKGNRPRPPASRAAMVPFSEISQSEFI